MARSIHAAVVQNRDGYSERDREAVAGLREVCRECEGEFSYRHMGEDGRCLACQDPEALEKYRNLKAVELWAIAYTEMMIRAIWPPAHIAHLFGPDDAYRHARMAYRQCRKHQGMKAGE